MLHRKLFVSSSVLFILISCSFVVGAEESSIGWTRTYGGPKHESASSLVATSDGGYAIAGETHSFGARKSDFWLVKTDAYGNMEWNRKYGGKRSDGACSLVATSDGGYALAGSTSLYEIVDSAFRLIKTDAVGNVEWNRTYEGIGYDNAYSLVATSDGGYALAGETHSFNESDGDFWLIETDEHGFVSDIQPPDSVSPEIHIDSPQRDEKYTTYSVYLTFSVSEKAPWMAYSVDGRDNVSIRGNTKLIGLLGGWHNITVYATDTVGNTGKSSTISFHVNTPDTEPNWLTLSIAGALMMMLVVASLGLLSYLSKRKQSS